MTTEYSVVNLYTASVFMPEMSQLSTWVKSLEPDKANYKESAWYFIEKEINYCLIYAHRAMFFKCIIVWEMSDIIVTTEFHIKDYELHVEFHIIKTNAFASILLPKKKKKNPTPVKIKAGKKKKKLLI